MSRVLKVPQGASSQDDELDFELAYQRSLTTAERFQMMLTRSRQIAEELIRRGHRRPVDANVRRLREGLTAFGYDLSDVSDSGTGGIARP